MFTRSASLATAALACVVSAAMAAETPKLGKPIAPDEIAAWDITIGPDGAGLPPGSGTAKQGEAVYAAKCVACHGEKGAGKPHDALVGGKDTLVAPQAPVRTVGSYWPYRRDQVAVERRALCGHRPHPASQRHRRRHRRDERRNPAQGEDAESRRLRDVQKG